MDKIYPSTRPYSRTDNLTLVPPKIKTCIAQSDFSHGRFCLLLLKVLSKYRCRPILLTYSSSTTNTLIFLTLLLRRSRKNLFSWSVGNWVINASNFESIIRWNIQAPTLDPLLTKIFNVSVTSRHLIPSVVVSWGRIHVCKGLFSYLPWVVAAQSQRDPQESTLQSI